MMKIPKFMTFPWKIIPVASMIMIFSSCIWMKMLPPPDADKNPLAGNNSCYLATASNMLAGAGYGTGNTVQARAEDIYNDMITEFGIANGGWADAAISWWLGSNNNTWGTNPYTVVTVYGNKSPKYPWNHTTGSRYIGNELRKCNFVGLSISWPVDGNTIGSGGHAITGWGDVSLHSNKTTPLETDPNQVRLTDSDRETGGDVQSYSYDSYTNPNPGGANEGNGWYIDYSDNHPYIKHIVVLSPTDSPADNVLTQKVIGSYRIHQTNKVPATDLHYTVGTDVNILSYRTWLDWTQDLTPVIRENDPRRSIVVDWNFTEKTVPTCTWVTITTEFVLPYWNAISYRDVRFTYPRGITGRNLAELEWKVSTPPVREPTRISNVTGGYLVGSFEIIDPSRPADSLLVGTYRFIHEYSYNQDPEQHVFSLAGTKGFEVRNLSFGHSYGYLSTSELWEFSNWMTRDSKTYRLGGEALQLKIDWEGRLPYPEGEYVKGIIPQKRNVKYVVTD